MEDMFGCETRHERDRDGREIVLIGRTKGRICKECKYLRYEQFSKKYYRCFKFKNYMNKNWKVKTEACQYFEEDK